MTQLISTCQLNQVNHPIEQKNATFYHLFFLRRLHLIQLISIPTPEITSSLLTSIPKLLLVHVLSERVEGNFSTFNINNCHITLLIYSSRRVNKRFSSHQITREGSELFQCGFRSAQLEPGTLPSHSFRLCSH